MLNQTNANALRQELKEVYYSHAQPKWNSLESIPPIHSGSFVKINIPNAFGNKVDNLIEYCREEDLYQNYESSFYTSTAESLMRHRFYNSRNDAIGWNYPDGYKDFCRIQNFTAKWVPEALNILKQDELEKLPNILSYHIEQAYELGLINPDNTLTEKINVLLKDASELKEHFNKTVISNNLQDKLINQSRVNTWQDTKKNWLNLVSCGDNYGYDGDTVERVVKKCFQQPPSTEINSLWQKVNRELISLINQFECFSDIESASNFETAMKNCFDLINEIRNSGESWPNVNDDLQTVGRYLEDITREKGFWQPIFSLMSLFKQNNNVIKNIYIIHKIDVDKVNKISQLLTCWTKIYSDINPQITTRNSQLGGDVILEAETKINELIDGYKESFRHLDGAI